MTDWLNVCLSVGNEPANVANWACSIFICKSVNHCRTIVAAVCMRHICSPSKSQMKRKMSCEYKSISCPFQVFISQSLCFSVSFSWSSFFMVQLYFPFYLLSHTYCDYILPLLFCPFSPFISRSVILLFFSLTICAIILTCTERGSFNELKYESVGQTDRRLTSWEREGQSGEKPESLEVAAGIKA